MCEWICCCLWTSRRKDKKDKTQTKTKDKRSATKTKTKTKPMTTKDKPRTPPKANVQSVIGRRDEQRQQKYVSFYGNNQFVGNKPIVNDNPVDNHLKAPSVMSIDKVTTTIYLPSSDCQTTQQVFDKRGYEMHGKLGKGGFGFVRKVLHKPTKRWMACKVIDMVLEKRERLLKTFKYEVYVLENAKNPYIIGLYDHFIISEGNAMTGYLFLELADGQTLDKEIKYSMDTETVKRYFIQIASGLAVLHRLQIAHKDLKPENILLTTNPKTKDRDIRLCDFGLSQQVYNKEEGVYKKGNFGGTRDYMAPEIIRLDVFRDDRHSPAFDYNPLLSDIWALGVCLYEMLLKRVPFSDTNNSERQLNNQMGRYYTIPEDMDPMIKDLLERLLDPDPMSRIQLTDVLMHPWIKDDVDWRLTEANPKI